MSITMNEAVIGAENTIKYTCRNPYPLWEALQAPGSNVSQAGSRQLSNQGHKRIALLGDKWLDLVLTMDWFAQNLPTGQWDQRKQLTVSNSKLARVCDAHSLDRFMNKNPSQKGLVSNQTKANLVEAIIGAVAEDGGLEAVRSVMQTLGILQ